MHYQLHNECYSTDRGLALHLFTECATLQTGELIHTSSMSTVTEGHAAGRKPHAIPADKAQSAPI